MDTKLKSLEKYEKFVVEWFLKEKKIYDDKMLCDYEKIQNLHDEKILTKDYKIIVSGALRGIRPSLTTLASKRYRKLDKKYRLNEEEIIKFENELKLKSSHLKQIFL